MMLCPGSLVSRTLALLILLGALFGSYRLIVAPVVDAHETAAQSIERSQMLLERYQLLAAQRDKLTRHIAARERIADGSAAYFDAPTDALAAAAVQDHVGSVIARAGGELHSTQVLASKPVEGVAGISRSRLMLNLSVDIEGLERLLYDLESDEPYLFIEEITIQTQTRHDDPQQRRLTVTLEVYGYAWTAEL